MIQHAKLHCAINCLISCSKGQANCQEHYTDLNRLWGFIKIMTKDYEHQGVCILKYHGHCIILHKERTGLPKWAAWVSLNSE